MKTPDTKYTIIRANSRGGADHGWLKANHSFSFANYYDPERVHFGALRVLNDDWVAPMEGFGKHPHDNMEIITIPLKGELSHGDSMGNSSVITTGEIQVMSAGSGVFHSEMNNNKEVAAELLQIWVYPDTKSVEPRYDQRKLDDSKMKNNLLNIIKPFGDDNEEGIPIYQQSWFHLTKLDQDRSIEYKTKKEGNGLYVFVIEGDISILGNKLSRRDAIAVTEAVSLEIIAEKEAKILIIDVPMKW
jgi:hypothetical protein